MYRKARTSRALIALLILTVTLGLLTLLRSVFTGSPEEANAQPAPLPIAAPAEPKPASPVVANNKPAIQRTTTPQYAIKAPSPATRPAAVARQAAPASTATLSQAKRTWDAGDTLEARNLLNAALQGGALGATDVRAAKKMLAEINQNVVFSPTRYKEDPYGGAHTVQAGESLQRIARNYDVPWELIARINNISDPRKLRAGQTIKVVKGPINALVDKSDFTIDLYFGGPGEAGSMYVTSFPVGLGRGDSTPTGVWQVDGKLKNPKFWGAGNLPPIEADDPENPLGERWVSLAGIDGEAVGQTSYGIHGTIEPESIGKMASLGCIRLHNQDVEVVYDMLVENRSTVTVRE